MTTGYVCMYCQYGRDSECMDRACNCCFGAPAEPSDGATVICANSYQVAKVFAAARRWPQHSWVYAEERRLHGIEPRRIVHLSGFWDRRDAGAIDALARYRLERTAQRALVDARRDAAKALPEAQRQVGDTE